MEARPEDVVAPVAESVVDAALYRDGKRLETPASVANMAQFLREQPDAFGWIGLYRPAEAQFLPVAEEFALHELAVEDAIVAHQRPKLERYGDTLFAVLRAATYLDKEEEVEFGELHVFVGSDFVVTVRHGSAPDLAAVRREADAGEFGRRLGVSRDGVDLSATVDCAKVVGVLARTVLADEHVSPGRRGQIVSPAQDFRVGRFEVEKKPSGRTPSAGSGWKVASGAPANGGRPKSGKV